MLVDRSSSLRPLPESTTKSVYESGTHFRLLFRLRLRMRRPRAPRSIRTRSVSRTEQYTGSSRSGPQDQERPVRRPSPCWQGPYQRPLKLHTTFGYFRSHAKCCDYHRVRRLCFEAGRTSSIFLVLFAEVSDRESRSPSGSFAGSQIGNILAHDVRRPHSRRVTIALVGPVVTFGQSALKWRTDIKT